MDAKRTGRPPKVPEPGTKVSLGLKVTGAIKRRLDEAARESGRTQSQEAEWRLTRSFEDAPLAAQAMTLAYGERTAGLAMMLAHAMHEAGTSCGFSKLFSSQGAADWLDDAYSFDQATQAVARILEFARPPGNPSLPDVFPPNSALHGLEAHWGRATANTLAQAISGEGATEDLRQWGQVIGKMLGSLTNRMAAARVADTKGHDGFVIARAKK